MNFLVWWLYFIILYNSLKIFLVNLGNIIRIFYWYPDFCYALGYIILQPDANKIVKSGVIPQLRVIYHCSFISLSLFYFSVFLSIYYFDLYICIYLYIYQFVWLPIYPSIYPSIYQFIYLSICLFIYISIYQLFLFFFFVYINLFTYLCIYFFSIYIYFFLFIYLSI